MRPNKNDLSLSKDKDPVLEATMRNGDPWIIMR